MIVQNFQFFYSKTQTQNFYLSFFINLQIQQKMIAFMKKIQSFTSASLLNNQFFSLQNGLINQIPFVKKPVIIQQKGMFFALNQQMHSSFSTLNVSCSSIKEKKEKPLESGYTIHQISGLDYQPVLKFLTFEFATNQPICAHLRVTEGQIAEYMSTIVKNCCESGLSYLIRMNGQVVAVHTAVQYEKSIIDNPISEKSKAIVSILTKVQQDYKPTDPKRTLNIFAAATNKEHQNKGLYQKLAQTSEKEWERNEFKERYASCTSELTAKMLKKLGYNEEKCIYYDDFIYKEEKPFQNIINHKSAKLMVRKYE